MGRAKQTRAMVMVLLMVVSIVGGVAALGSSALADKHTREDAPDLTGQVNFTIAFPEQTDHYPGDMNEENGSIEYFSAGSEAFEEMGAPHGVWMNFVIIDASWIDYTACSTENTAAYGIDRGNNNSGTQIDEDLVEHTLESTFRDDGITVEFYNWEDFAGDPPYLAAEDAQVAAQGKGSNAGPCLTLTSEPGWYQMQGFLNGTAAEEGCTEEGNKECEPENKERAGVNVKSNYMYVCECDSEQEAEDQLGPKPGTGGSTPTPTESGDDTPTPTQAGDDTPTATPEPGDDTPTPTEANGGGDESTATETQANGGNGGGGGNSTPTVGGGPGFGAIVALVGLLGSALLLYRRR